MAEAQDSKEELEKEYAQLEEKIERLKVELQAKNEKIQEREAQVDLKNRIFCVHYCCVWYSRFMMNHALWGIVAWYCNTFTYLLWFLN